MSGLLPEYYNAWRIREHLTMPDPEETKTRYHTYLFIEHNDATNNPPASDDAVTSPTSSNIMGWTHEVTGDISTSTGMIYLHKPVPRSPENSEVFYSKEFLGRVPADGYPKNVDEVCRSIQPPGCQKKFNPETMRYEGVVFEGSNAGGGEGRSWRFYKPGEERKGYFKCTEWLVERVLPKLVAEGMIVPSGAAERSGEKGTCAFTHFLLDRNTRNSRRLQ